MPVCSFRDPHLKFISHLQHLIQCSKQFVLGDKKKKKKRKKETALSSPLGFVAYDIFLDNIKACKENVSSSLQLPTHLNLKRGDYIYL